MSECLHRKGDYAFGMWICAVCYRPLPEKPKRYHTGFLGGAPRQEIAWEAEIATADGVPFGKFLTWMVSYLRLRSLWTISKDEARTLCLEALRDMGDPYGSKWCDWSRDSAKEIVREAICAYWDDALGGANS